MIRIRSLDSVAIYRCMLKYPSSVPAELNTQKAIKLLIKLPGLPKDFPPSTETVGKLLSKWNEAYLENLDRVMFNNLSSYEP